MLQPFVDDYDHIWNKIECLVGESATQVHNDPPISSNLFSMDTKCNVSDMGAFRSSNLEQVSVHDIHAAEGAHALGGQRGHGGGRGRGRRERRRREAVLLEDVVRAGGALSQMAKWRNISQSDIHNISVFIFNCYIILKIQTRKCCFVTRPRLWLFFFFSLNSWEESWETMFEGPHSERTYTSSIGTCPPLAPQVMLKRWVIWNWIHLLSRQTHSLVAAEWKQPRWAASLLLTWCFSGRSTAGWLTQ